MTDNSDQGGGASAPLSAGKLDPNTLPNSAIAQILDQCAAQTDNKELRTVLGQAAGRLRIHWTTFAMRALVMDEEAGRIGKRARRLVFNWLRRYG